MRLPIKHVPLMEETPCEAVQVNVVGSRLVADFLHGYNVDMMVMISTDKAVNPTNVMGASKRLAEIYVQSLGLAIERGEVKGKTRFVTTRFGNVLGSNGSVIPISETDRAGWPVTVTDPGITRFHDYPGGLPVGDGGGHDEYGQSNLRF